MTHDFKHVAPGQGRVYRVSEEGTVTLKITSEDTDGTFSVLERVVPSRGGGPRQILHREDQILHVLEGDFEFQVGDQEIEAKSGSFLLIARGLPHRIKNVGPGPGKIMVIVRPAGFEKFVEEFSRLSVETLPDLEEVSAIARKHGVEYV